MLVSVSGCCSPSTRCFQFECLGELSFGLPDIGSGGAYMILRLPMLIIVSMLVAEDAPHLLDGVEE